MAGRTIHYAECITRYTEQGSKKICSYQLRYSDGTIGIMSADTIKYNIEMGLLQVTNLTYTRDGRLLLKKPKVQKNVNKSKFWNNKTVKLKSGQSVTYDDIERVLAKGTLAGRTKKCSANSDEYFLIYSISNKEHILYIPNTTTIIGNEGLQTIAILEGRVIVVGGSSLISAVRLFSDGRITEFDFTFFDTSNVESMEEMFANNKASYIDVSNLDTSKVWRFSEMFAYCKAHKIIFGGKFTTTNARTMVDMFRGCEVYNLDLSTFDTRKVDTMNGMFNGFVSDVLDLNTFRNDSLELIDNMFSNCRIKTLKVEHFDVSKVIEMVGVFEGACIQRMDISSWNTSVVRDMTAMFNSFTGCMPDVSHFDTSNVEYMSEIFDNMSGKVLDLTSFSTLSLSDTAQIFKECRVKEILVSALNSELIEILKKQYHGKITTV